MSEFDRYLERLRARAGLTLSPEAERALRRQFEKAAAAHRVLGRSPRDAELEALSALSRPELAPAFRFAGAPGVTRRPARYRRRLVLGALLVGALGVVAGGALLPHPAPARRAGPTTTNATATIATATTATASSVLAVSGAALAADPLRYRGRMVSVRGQLYYKEPAPTEVPGVTRVQLWTPDGHYIDAAVAGPVTIVKDQPVELRGVEDGETVVQAADGQHYRQPFIQGGQLSPLSAAAS